MTRTGEQWPAWRRRREDQASVVELTRDLVRIPSRGGIDPYDPVLDCMASWLDAHGLECRRLAGPRRRDGRAGLRGERVPSPVPGTCWTPAWTPRRSATSQPGGSRRHQR